MALQAEDVTAAFIGIITLVLNLIPGIVGLPNFPPAYSAGLLSLAVILKTVLGNISVNPTNPITYKITGTNPQGQPFISTTVISPPDTIEASLARLTALGFTSLTAEIITVSA